ncbi:hypothetical protein CWC29_007400 [Pseudoalteromonas sp. S4498]|uniref:hypothetical protein n=1 Tax=Pseudoalteromonas galatheae TaxID=579562 RepID=UPI001108D7C0|nr:hypothetical protein [Pseudoalteromonas galatheae]NKC18670.1 hypothetical protein [Pseudoalteromonas galatheae]
MLSKLNIEANFPTELVGEGQFIKVMNSEAEVRLTAYNAYGSEVFSTEARAGFEITTNQVFARLVLQSQQAQKVEVWSSAHRLSYDALSTKASRSLSFIVDHFGLSQRLLPFDPSQSNARISCDNVGFWVGGEGVNAETGMYIPAQTIYEHNSAAPLYAFIAARPDQRVSPSSIYTVNIDANLTARSAIYHNGYIIHESAGGSSTWYATNVDTGVSRQYVEPLESPISYGDYIYALRGWDKRDLIIADTNGILQKPRNPNHADFTANCLVEKHGVFYVLGAGYGTAPNKIITFVDGVWSTKTCPEILLDRDIERAYSDPYSNDILLFCGDSLYVTNDEFVTVRRIEGVTLPIGIKEPPTFTDSTIMFTTSSGAIAYIRDSGEVVDIGAAFPEFVGGCLIGRQWVILAGNKIYTTDDALKSYHVAYTHPEAFATSTTYCKPVGNELQIWQTGATSKLLRMTLEPDLDSPKARFRVFKESF